MRQKTLERTRRKLDRVRHTQCHPRIAYGLRQVAAGLTPSHSLTSRNPSVWALIRRWLDEPVIEFLATYPHTWNSDLLEGFAPSTMGKRPPALQPITERALVCPSSPDSFTRRSKRELASRTHAVADYRTSLSEWDANLRFAIRSAYTDKEGEDSHLRRQFPATLDALRLLIDELDSMEPVSVRPTRGAQDRVSYAQVSSNTGGFCELCWRYTERYQAERAREANSTTPRKESTRYCAYHRPDAQPAEHHCYRADIRYRDAFHRELDALKWGEDSEHVFRFQPPTAAGEEEIRKAAYDTVHCGIRPLRGQTARGDSFAEKVWQLHREDLSQPHIGRRLGATKQAVSRALKQLHRLAEIQQAEAQVDPLSEESFSLHTQSTRALFQEIRALRRQQWSTARIARHVGRFKHTVKAIYRWLDLHDAAASLRSRGLNTAAIERRLRIPHEAVDIIADMALDQERGAGDSGEDLDKLLRPIRRFLDQPGVSEVTVNQPHGVFVEQSGKDNRVYIPELDTHRLHRLASGIARAHHQPLSEQQPRLTGWLETGERVRIARPPLLPEGAFLLSIRKPEIPNPL